MDVAAGHRAGRSKSGWWAVESSQSSSQAASHDTTVVPVELIREYRVLAEVAAAMASGFLLLNQREHITYFNASALRLLGIQSRDVIEQPAFDIRGQLRARAADPERARQALDALWARPEEELSVDLALVDAALRWLRVRSFPMRDPQGLLLGRGLLLDDITLERSAAESRTETLALAAHELKTPLAIIKGAATTLLSSSMRWDAALQREMLQMIDTQADRLYDILNTLLDVWRFDTGAQSLRLAHIYLTELLSQLVERWRKRAPRHVFALQLLSDAPPVSCDAVRVTQALDALLDNAVAYSPPGSAITIRLETNDVEARISVVDQGIGIALEHLDRIFDRFYRVRQGSDAPPGSGLGLAVARAIFETHGGKIWADSPGLEQGATLYATLPFAPPREATGTVSLPAQTQPDRSLPAPHVSGSLRAGDHASILVAENDARVARYLRAHLEEEHYRVQVVSHGVPFLRQLDLQDPNLIVLATQLADMSGAELLQRLREFSHTPVILLCDDCDDDERARLLDLGADDLVLKPFGMKELLARVRAVLRRRAASPDEAAGEAIFTNGDLVIDYAQHQVWLRGGLVKLSSTEYRLLSVLAHNAGRVLTHEILLERVWGSEYQREVDFVWVYISRLRRKIEDDPRHPRYILTIPDVGYKLAKIS
jgi:DNA-binding response OmpR family regulator/signal transduction histidine kinase